MKNLLTCKLYVDKQQKMKSSMIKVVDKFHHG